MYALLAIDVRSVCCVIGLLVAFGGTELLAQPPTRPRVAPWEIEPTEETKRRIKDWEFDWPESPQVVISARLGEPRIINFKLAPRSIQIRDPGMAMFTWNGKKGATLHGLATGITTMTVTYPPVVAGGEDETIRYLVRVHVDF